MQDKCHGGEGNWKNKIEGGPQSTMVTLKTTRLTLSINLESSLPFKRKAVLEEPTIPLCTDDDCGLEIEGIDLLSCDAPGCNLTVCTCAHIFP